MLSTWGRFTPSTMKLDHGKWPIPMVQLDGPTPMIQFLKMINLQSLLGLSLVNQIWTTRNDHAPKSDCVDFFDLCPKKDYKKNKVRPFFSLLLSSFFK